MREAARVALNSVAARFSSDAPSIDLSAVRRRYSAFDDWPADAQLGFGVLAWTLGPGFALPGFREAANALCPDFARAARAVGVGEHPTLITLGAVARRALDNGAVVLARNLDPGVLYWPQRLSSCRSGR